MQPGPPFPLVVLAVPLKHGGPRKRSWLCGIDRGHAPRRIAPRLIASCMSRCHGERPQSSPGPKPRPGWPLSVACPHARGPCTVFNFLNTVAGERGSSHDPELSGSQSPRDTSGICASCLRSHFSRWAPRLSCGAEHDFMDGLRSDLCSCLSLRSTFCSPFATRKLAVAVSGLSASAALGPGLMAYPLLTCLPPSAQQHLLSIFGWSWSSHATIAPCKGPVDLPALWPPVIWFLSPPVSPNSSSA